MLQRVVERGREGGMNTALVADSAARDAVQTVAGVRQLCGPQVLAAGPVVRVRTDGLILPVVYGLSRAEAGDVLVIENRDPACRSALLGDIVLMECARRGLAAVVCSGMIRDLAAARAQGVPVWALGTSPVPAAFGTRDALREGDVRREPDCWAYADEDGVVTVAPCNPRDVFVRAMLKKRREDVFLEKMKTASLTDLMNITAYVEDDGALEIGF